jgi:hypothetical protein
MRGRASETIAIKVAVMKKTTNAMMTSRELFYETQGVLSTFILLGMQGVQRN